MIQELESIAALSKQIINGCGNLIKALEEMQATENDLHNKLEMALDKALEALNKL